MIDKVPKNVEQYILRTKDDLAEANSVADFVKLTKNNAKYASCMSQTGSLQFKGSIPAHVWFAYVKQFGTDYWTDKRQNEWLREHWKFSNKV